MHNSSLGMGNRLHIDIERRMVNWNQVFKISNVAAIAVQYIQGKKRDTAHEVILSKLGHLIACAYHALLSESHVAVTLESTFFYFFY